MSDAIAQAVQILKSGHLVAIPTETVYGLAADAANPLAINKIFSTKGRPTGHPLIVHIADPGSTQLNQEEKYIAWEHALSLWARDVPSEALLLASAFWPGPLTMILPKAKHVLAEITGGQETVGIRCPNHPVALELLSKFDGGLAAPSANKFGHVSPTTAEHVRDEFPDLFVLDGGSCHVGIESTIVDLTRLDLVGPVILRPGAISQEQIDGVLGAASSRLTETLKNTSVVSTPRVSGSLSAHYAPRTKLVLYRDETTLINEHMKPTDELAWVHFDDATKIKLPENLAASACTEYILPNNPVEMARNLYATLRSLDKLNYKLIIFQDLPAGVLWDAVRDRLSRAAVGSGVI
jgi:L-threonylcarbamoyladenylate synthase